MGRRRRERGSMVPSAEFTSYYGRPILKRPTWKSPDVPIYFWAGGVAGSTAALAALADATGRPTLRRSRRVVAAGSALVGTAALIHDLCRPARFLYTLRVIKPTSPLSIGTWILSPFAAMACAAAASELTGIAPRLGRLAGWGAAALGPMLASYTAVLVADTAVADNRPAARLAAVGAAVELVAGRVMEERLARLPGGIEQAYRTGRAGRWNRAAHALTVAGGVGAVLGRRSRVCSAASGLALLAGSLTARSGRRD